MGGGDAAWGGGGGGGDAAWGGGDAAWGGGDAALGGSDATCGDGDTEGGDVTVSSSMRSCAGRAVLDAALVCVLSTATLVSVGMILLSDAVLVWLGVE